MLFSTEKSPTGEEKPVLNEEPSDIEVNVGEPVSLRCSASGNPSPEIFWIHNRLIIPPRTRHKHEGYKMYVPGGITLQQHDPARGRSSLEGVAGWDVDDLRSSDRGHGRIRVHG